MASEFGPDRADIRKACQDAAELLTDLVRIDPAFAPPATIEALQAIAGGDALAGLIRGAIAREK